MQGVVCHYVVVRGESGRCLPFDGEVDVVASRVCVYSGFGHDSEWIWREGARREGERKEQKRMSEMKMEAGSGGGSWWSGSDRPLPLQCRWARGLG